MKRIFTALALTAALSAPAVAAEPGGYIDVDLGGASYSNANFGGPGNLTFANPGTFQIGGGYRFSPNLAVEGGLVGIGDSTIYGPGYTDTLRTGAIYGAAVGLLPLGPQFDLFGKIGLASVHMQELWNGGAIADQTQANLMFGVGGQININRNWGIRAQYMNFGSVSLYLGLPSVGLSTFTVGGIYTF